MAHPPKERTLIARRFLPRFSQVAFLAQMPHLDTEEAIAEMKGEPLTDEDRKELEERVLYARKWLARYAPEQYRYELHENDIPEAVRSFSPEQKHALQEVLSHVRSREKLDGQTLHTRLHEIRQECGLDAKLFFSALYQSFLGKDSGPKAGWFLSVLDKKFLEKRLGEVSL